MEKVLDSPVDVVGEGPSEGGSTRARDAGRARPLSVTTFVYSAETVSAAIKASGLTRLNVSLDEAEQPAKFEFT